MNKKNLFLNKIINCFVSLLLIFQSFAPGLLYAQEATSAAAVESTPSPSVELNPSPTGEPQVSPSPESTPTLEPSPSVEPTASPEASPSPSVLPEVSPEIFPSPEPSSESTPADQVETVNAPEQTEGQPNAPPDESPLPTQTPEPSPSMTLDQPVEGHLAATILENTDAESLELDLSTQSDVSSASLSTDKADYAPTDTAVITGTDFPKSADLKLIITADNYRFEAEVKTDENGSFVYFYQLDGTYRPLYNVEAQDPSGQILATTSFTDAAPLGKDFDQCANQDPTLGECNWIGSALQNNNSEYNEGMSVPQRVLFTNIPTTSDNVHTLTFSHQSTKGGKHAYDFLTAYNQGNNPAITLNPCDDLGGNAATCNSLRGGANNLLVNVPDDPYVSKDGSTQSRIDAYETAYGNRQIKIYGGSSITSASFSSISHDVANSADTGDSDVSYTLTWTSASSDILIEMAGHISLGVDPAINPIGWGSGLGAGSVSGGPYHFKLNQLDGSAVGAQDNQIQAGAVNLPGTITIIKNTDPDDAQDFNFSTNGNGLSSFSLDDDSDSTLSNTKTFTGLTPGSFAVTEDNSAEFTLSNLSCTDPTGNTTINGSTANINLAAGETVTCTFTNSRNGGSVKVHKFVDTNGDGIFDQTSDSNANDLGFRWGLDGVSPTTDFGTEVSGVTAGSHSVNENTVPDYQFVSWFINGGQGSCTSPDGTSLPASITVNSNQRTEITLCNARDTGLLTVNKVLDPANDSGLFNLQIDSSTAGTGANVGNGGTTGQITVITGTHNVGETAGSSTSLSDYTSSISCTNGQSGQGTALAVSVNEGDNISCTITNTRNSGTLQVIKNVDLNGDGDFTDQGETGATDWTWDIANGEQNIATGQSRTLNAGTYTISEDPKDDFHLVGWSCSDGSSGTNNSVNATVTTDTTPTCTFTNARDTGTIKVIKDVVPNDNGATGWDFSISGLTNNTVSDLQDEEQSGILTSQTGSYTVTESAHSGTNGANYNTSYSCTDGTGILVSGSGTTTPPFTLASNKDVVCTFTNTIKNGTIIVEKQMVGGTASFNFTGDVAGTISENGGQLQSTVLPGTYTSTEGLVTGWDLTGLSCDDSNSPTPSTVDMGTKTATFEVDPGETVTCTFTNTQRGRIIISKFTDPANSEETFDFTTNYSQGFNLGNGDSNDSGLLPPGIYSVTEDVPGGWDLTSTICSDGSGPSQIVLDPGETVTCDFTNTQRGRVIVTKLTIPVSDTSTEFNFSTDLDENGDFTLTGNGSSEVFPDVEPGNYFLEESVPEGWQLTSAKCSGEEEFENGGEINLSPGETIECTFTNTQKGTIIVEKQTEPEGVSENFTFTGDAAGSISDNGQIVVSGLLPGQYTSTESDPTPGFDLTSIVCDDNDSVGDLISGTATFNLKAGEIVKCTFTNTQRGHLIVEKTTVPGGEPDLFIIGVSGSGTIIGSSSEFITDAKDAFFSMTPGTYSVTEDFLTGWDETSNTCQDVIVSAGDTVTCTITNTRRGEIIIEKQTNPDGAEQSFEFESDYDENFFLSDGESNNSGLLQPGIYSVSENTPPGWKSESSCSDGSNPDSIDLNPGETVTCTFTNTREEGKIQIEKIIDADGNLQTSDDQTPGVEWSFDVNGTSDDTSDPDSDLTDENGLVEFDSLKTGEYEVIETVQPGYHIISASCLADEELETGQFNGEDRIEGVEVNSNDEVSCTFINTRDTGSITIIKNIDNNGDGDTIDDEDTQNAQGWTYDIAEGDQDNPMGGSKTLATGTYTVSEDQQDGYQLLGWFCSNEQTGTANSITLDVSVGSEITCTFENQILPPVLSLSKTNDKLGIDVSAGSSVLYTLTVTLTGSPLSNVLLTDLPPAGFNYRSGSWTAVSSVRGDLKPSITGEPTYASPGTWNLGNMTSDEVVTLTYLADIDTGTDPGLYKDLAWSKGTGAGSTTVLANDNSGFFVGTEVNVVKAEGASTGVEVVRTEEREGEVLGVSASLPATGANILWMIFAGLLLSGGIGLIWKGKELRKKYE